MKSSITFTFIDRIFLSLGILSFLVNLSIKFNIIQLPQLIAILCLSITFVSFGIVALHKRSLFIGISFIIIAICLIAFIVFRNF